MNLPKWFKILGIVVAVLVVAILIAGALAVPYRSTRPPTGYDQSRVHWNTKNSTRFDGQTLADVAVRVSQAVYPATDPANTPDAVILYSPDNWQGGLAAASLLRPLNAVLLPVTGGLAEELNRLQPAGSDYLDGGQLLLVDDVTAPEGDFSAKSMTTADIAGLLEQAGAPPQHVIIVDSEDPTRPWWPLPGWPTPAI